MNLADSTTRAARVEAKYMLLQHARCMVIVGVLEDARTHILGLKPVEAARDLREVALLATRIAAALDPESEAT